jgi:hypothetical protein
MGNGNVPVVKSVPIGGQIGQLRLENTRLPAEAAGYGFLVLLLDPVGNIADTNRTDNIFAQFVNVANSTTLTGNISASCSVASISSGKDTFYH